ncbi:UPF0262 family protein, partial [Hyphomicrobium sp.]|uniref:UPF0262 family protein n=1 Tax=Hyphomicrobium sp. TaxID=82 RepID=UPI0025BE8C11
MTDTDASTETVETNNRLAEIVLDPASIGRGNANIEHEREVAIYDLLDGNSFELEGRDQGPYKLTIGLVEDRLALTVFSASEASAMEGAAEQEPI